VAHAFDSGFARPQRRLIREAIVAQLRTDLQVSTLPGSTGELYVTAVVELAAPFVDGDGDLMQHLHDAVAGRSPVIAVALGDRSFRATNTDDRYWRGTLEVHVYVLSKHARGLLERLRGGDPASLASNAADPGLETAMEHVFERLAGFTPSSSHASELRPVRESFPYVADDFSIAELVFECDAQTDVNPNRGLTQIATEVLHTHTDDAAGDPSAVDALSELEP